MKKIVSRLFMLVGLFVVSVQSALAEKNDQCEGYTSNKLGAEYVINNNNSHSTLWLWRNGKQVIQYKPLSKQALYYYQAKPSLLQVVRLFEEFKTGIEYGQSELKDIGQSKMTWAQHYQLIDDVFFEKLTLDRSEPVGCDELQYYSGEINGHKFKVSWLKELNVLTKYEDESSVNKIVITLKNKQLNSKKVESIFSDFLSYNMVDYADIGDNESDPFIAKMIHQGFIEHGASGFYNASGETISHGHH